MLHVDYMHWNVPHLWHWFLIVKSVSGVFDQVNFANLLILNRLMTRRNQFTKLRETDWPGYGETMGEWDC